jgi:hypothetical protein
MSSNLSIDARRVLALVLALVVVASMSGSATVALLSDNESIAVGLTASNADTAGGGVSGFDVEPLDTCTVGNATVNQSQSDLQAAATFEVEGDGCAKLSVWVSESWLDRTGEDVDDVVIGHKGAGGWVFLETAVGEQKHGWYELTATTTGFSPFGLFVPNESRASPAGSNGGDAAAAFDSDADVNQTENESVDGNRTVAGNDTKRNGSVGGTQVSDAPEPSDGNESVPANGDSQTNGTATTNGTVGDDASTGNQTDGKAENASTPAQPSSDPDGASQNETTPDDDTAQNGTVPSNGADSNGSESGSGDDEATTDGEAEAETTESAASDPETTETAETETPKSEATETETDDSEATETETAEPKTDETTTETESTESAGTDSESTESASTPTATKDGETTATPSSQDA